VLSASPVSSESKPSIVKLPEASMFIPAVVVSIIPLISVLPNVFIIMSPAAIILSFVNSSNGCSSSLFSLSTIVTGCSSIIGFVSQLVISSSSTTLVSVSYVSYFGLKPQMSLDWLTH